jgi:anti-anti-sigma regulatory factor
MHLVTLTAKPRGLAPEHATPGVTPRHHIWIDPGDPATLRLRGDIDLDTVGRLCRRVPGARDVADAGRALARQGVRRVDGSEVTFADSSAVDLICALRAGTRPGRLHLRGPSPALRLVLDATGTSALVHVDP